MSLSDHHDVALIQWRWINTKIDNYVLIAIVKSEPICKLRNILRKTIEGYL